jgi:hypothetical protein
MWAIRATDAGGANGLLLTRIAVPPLVGLGVAWGVGRAVDHTLYELDFLSGWFLLAALAAFAIAWWRGAPAADPRRLAAPVHAVGCAVLVALFACHVRMTLPLGWIQIVLFAAFVLYLAGWAVGVVRAYAPGDSARRSGWLRVHACSTSVLLTLGVLHGVFSHAHGLLAYVFMGK